MKYFKLNQTVYCTIYGKGVIISILNETYTYPIIVEFKTGKTAEYTKEGRLYSDKSTLVTLSQNPIPEIVNKPLEDEYIPFTWEDRELLRGKWVKGKNTTSENLVIYISIDKIGTDEGNFTYRELLEKMEFVDGKPCGKLAN